MPQISKVERDHDIKQVSRLDDLKPATEKTVSKAIPQIRGKPEIQDTSQALTSSMNAAKQASIAAIRHAKTISDSSDKSEDQEAIEKMEASVRNAAADSTNAALGAKDALKRQIKKKSPDIKNTKDIKNGTRSIRKADRAIKSATEASQIAAKTANQAAKEAAITSTKVATTRKAERLAKKSAEWVKKIVKGIRKVYRLRNGDVQLRETVAAHGDAGQDHDHPGSDKGEQQRDGDVAGRAGKTRRHHQEYR